MDKNLEDIKKSLKHNHQLASTEIDKYLCAVLKDLEEFRISDSGKSEDWDEIVVKSISKLSPYRDQLIELFITISHYPYVEENMRVLHKFFERISSYMYPPKDAGHQHNLHQDDFRFITHELFLYAIAIFIKAEKFDHANYLLTRLYYSDIPRKNKTIFSFTHIRQPMERLKKNRASILKKRCLQSYIIFKDLVQADFIIFLRACINIVKQEQKYSKDHWLPETWKFMLDDSQPFEIFARSKSTNFFEKIKSLLGMNEFDDLEKLWKLYEASPHYRIPGNDCPISPEELCGFDQLAKLP